MQDIFCKAFDQLQCRTHTKGEPGSGPFAEELARRRGSGIPSLNEQLNICKLAK